MTFPEDFLVDSMESLAITVGMRSPREHPMSIMLTSVTGRNCTYRSARLVPIMANDSAKAL